MKRTYTLLTIGCGLLFAASTCFAQMYTVTDLRTFVGGTWSTASGINAYGQIVGAASFADDARGHPSYHAFRTAPNRPINSATDDLGTLGGSLSWATGIDVSGQVVGWASSPKFLQEAFRTAPNSSINPATDALGTLDGTYSIAAGINKSGQVVGHSQHAFRTAPNSPINFATDDLGTLGGSFSEANGINDSGEVVGASYDTDFIHAFRTAPNSPINPATDNLGGLTGIAWGINAFGQVVGYVYYPGWSNIHAFRTAPHRLINPATDDLGTLDPQNNQMFGLGSWAWNINAYGEVVGESTVSTGGEPPFLYSGGIMHDLNELVPVNSGWVIVGVAAVNDRGQIAATGYRGGESHAVLLNPVYKAFVQQPINADGSSVFKAKRGVIPIKFRLTQYDARTCTLMPATISVTRAAGGTLTTINQNTHGTGTDFRITGCQYHYSLEAKSLGVGVYRVDISIEGVFVGHAVFALK